MLPRAITGLNKHSLCAKRSLSANLARVQDGFPHRKLASNRNRSAVKMQKGPFSFALASISNEGTMRKNAKKRKSRIVWVFLSGIGIEEKEEAAAANVHLQCPF